MFGDGDPNASLRAARLRSLAEAIRAGGGAVVAEQIAPFLDPPTGPEAGSGSPLVEESWVLPAVLELGGRPEVADDGTIVYIFDELQVSAVASDANLLLADPSLARLDSLGADELAELASQRRIDLRSPSLSAPELRAALRRWAESRLDLGAEGPEGWAGEDSAASRTPRRLGGGGGRRGAGARDTLFPGGYLEERKVAFSAADGGQLFAAGALGLVNLGFAPPRMLRASHASHRPPSLLSPRLPGAFARHVRPSPDRGSCPLRRGCAYLGALLTSLPPGLELPPGFIGTVGAFYPALLAYAVAFVALPAYRALTLGATNAQIDARNGARRRWRDALRAGGEQFARRAKVAAARSKALRIVGEGDLAFDSAKDLTQQPDAFKAPDLDDFDRRLAERADDPA